MKEEKEQMKKPTLKDRLTEGAFELLLELGAIVVGIVIVCLFPLPIFEDWPELAIFLGALIVMGIGGLAASMMHLIKRKDYDSYEEEKNNE